MWCGPNQCAAKLNCIGTPQHLKSKFGHGFQLDITLKTQSAEGAATDVVADQVSVEQKLLREFKVSLIERNQNKFVYDIQFHDGQQVKLSEIFRILEGMKDDLNIESYALSGTTLEQVFIKMANQKAPPFVPAPAPVPFPVSIELHAPVPVPAQTFSVKM